MEAAASVMILLPVGTEPVKEILATSGWEQSRCPVSPSPWQHAAGPVTRMSQHHQRHRLPSRCSFSRPNPAVPDMR